MINTSKRKILLIIITTISILSTYQFIDVYSRFKFLFADIANNLSQSVVIFMIIVLLLSITSFLAIIFNWKLLKKSHSISDNNLIDQTESRKHNQLGFLYFGYLAFSGLVEGFGMFVLIETIKDYNFMGNLPRGMVPIIVGTITVGLGIVFIIDGIKIKRAITAV